MDYFIADTHFNHANIIVHCKRPFASLEEMNFRIVEQWNNTVCKSDNVYFLGDFSLGGTKIAQHYISQLNGNKLILRGNHDKKISLEKWIEIGFDEVIDANHQYEEFVLSHRPLNSTFIKNIHGHTHNNRENDPLHFCVSVEMINYTPISIRQIRRRWPVETSLSSEDNN